ncbi:MAG: orotidine-5'-phosphate decarboxylase [Lachnospirales bacterium]
MVDKLIEKIVEMKNPTVVGLDPKISYMPKCITEKYDNVYDMFYNFNKSIIDEIYDIVPAVKPQIAMYEEHGIEGQRCYYDTVKYAQSKGMIVIGDAKRGDISSTAKSYSLGHLGNEKESFGTDFLTVNPYMGYDSIQPFEEEMQNFERGLFILLKTSNPNSFQIQNLKLENGKYVYEEVASLISTWGEKFIGKYGYSSMGAVVGGTHKEEMEHIRKLIPNVFFLVPGYGAQGGKAEDIACCFDEKGHGAIVNSSRGILLAYRNEKYNNFSDEEFAKASRSSAIDMRDDIVKNAKISFK